MRKSTRVFSAVFLFALLAFGQTASPLVPGFSMRPASPHVGDVVKFTDYSAGSPAEWLWDFGDGSISILQHPEHIYAEAGSHEISLTVDDGTGPVTLRRIGTAR